MIPKEFREKYLLTECMILPGIRGRVDAGISNDTAESAVNSIRKRRYETGRRNRIGHRMSGFIPQNRRGKLLTDYVTIISLISNTETDRGLGIRAVSDGNVYEKGGKLSDKESDKVSIYRYEFHGDWNYKILPNK